MKARVLERKIAAQLMFALAILALCCTPAFGGPVTLDNSYSGWYDDSGNHSYANTNYYSGNQVGRQLNNFFVFDLATVSGTVMGATFNVFSYDISVPGTYSIYSTSLTPAVENDCSGCVDIFNSLTSGSLIGSLVVTTSDAYANLAIDLNAAGLAWLTANAGGDIVLGGSFPQPNTGGDNYLFGYSSYTQSNNLTIATTTIPEPSTMAFMGGGILLLLLGGLRRLRNR